MENAFRKVYTPIVVPLVVCLLVGVLTAFYFFQLKEQENLILKMKDYSRQLNDVFLDIELTYNPVIRDLFIKEYLLYEQTEDYSQAFSDDFVSELKQAVRDLPFDTLQIDEINYYRISEEGRVYETDFLLDKGLDLSEKAYFWKPFEEALPGDIILKNLDSEILTGDIRLYSYVKLPDNSFFESGIRFKGMNDYIEKKGHDTFGGLFSDLTIFKEGSNPVKSGVELTDTHREYLKQAENENKPVFRLNKLIKGTLYYVQQSRYGVYRYILNITYYYYLIIIIVAAVVFIIIYVHRKRMNGYLQQLSSEIAKPIKSLESQMKTFDVRTSEGLKNDTDSDIVEIQSISKSFNNMCSKTRDSYEEIETMNKELELSYSENQSLIDKIESFLEIPQVMFSTRDMNELLSFCYKKLLSIVSDVDCSLLGVNREEKIEFLSGSGIDYEKLNSLNVNAQKYINKKKILFKNFEEGEFIQEMELQINQPELHDLIASVQQVLIIPAVSKDHYYGHLAFYNFQGSSNKLTFDDYRIAEFFSGFLKAFLMIKEFSELEMDIQKETIHAIIQLLEKHDPYTKGHSENVARLSMEFATYLGLSEKRIQDLYWAGIVHDMGKILIPQSLLNKPSRLTTGEFEEIKKHPVYAYDVFKNSYPMKEIALYVKHHHEKYNGKGYPDGLKGKAIPYESRILCIADAWDAMTSERSYKDRLNKTEAISEIMQNKGEQFDPKLTDEWLSFISNHQ